MPVFDAVGLVCGGAETGLSVRFILGIISIKPDHFAVTLESEHVGSDTVEEPSVVADDHGAAGKILQCLFQGAHGVYVQVIGRLVKEKDIGLFLQHAGQMDAVSFPSGEHRHLFLLIGPGEIEAGHIGARIYLPLAELNGIISAGNDLPDGLVRIEDIAALIDVCQLYGFSDLEGARIRLFLPGDHPEKGGLSCSVRSDNPYDSARREGESHSFHKNIVAVCLAHVIGLDDDIAQPGSRGDIDFQLF